MSDKIINIKNAKKKITASLQIKSFDDTQADYFTFEGFASTFGNLDHDHDVIVAGAFKNSLKNWAESGSNVPMLWQHDRQEPIGIFSNLEENDQGLFVTGQMPRTDSFVRDRVIPQIKIGSITSMSIGFYVRDYEIDENEDLLYIIYYLKEIDLKEISLVTMPANPLAVITNLKYEDLKAAGDRDLEKMFTNGVKCSHKIAKTIVSSLKNSRFRDESACLRDVDLKEEEVFEEYLKKLKNITND